ncbi:MAG: hypothetical protein RL501_144 [Bacteroidota bacterium]|jgi:hypothetical protein
MKALDEQERHNLAMNLVGESLKELGYEFIAVNSTLKKHPQFVCEKDRKLIFVVVQAFTYPDHPELPLSVMDKMYAHAQTFNAQTFFAGVGLQNTQDPTLPLYLNEPYTVVYTGLIPYETAD